MENDKVKEVMEEIRKELLKATENFIGKQNNKEVQKEIIGTTNYILIEGKLEL